MGMRWEFEGLRIDSLGPLVGRPRVLDASCSLGGGFEISDTPFLKRLA